MENHEKYSVADFLVNPVVMVAVVVGGSLLFLGYILRLFRIEHDAAAARKNHSEQGGERKKEAANGKGKKKQLWTGRNEKKAFTSPWLLKTLKNHSGQVLSIDYSSSGKYLASCGEEDPDPDPDLESGTSSDGSKKTSRSSSADPSPRTKGLSRRQRKNRRRDDSSPDSKKKTKKMESTTTPPPAISEQQFGSLLYPHLLTYEQMYSLGYPVQCARNKSVVFYINHPFGNKQRKPFDVNAREFVPSSGSSSSSSSEADSEESWEYEPLYSPRSGVGAQRTCVRCSKGFFVTADEYLTQERCLYHWGKLRSPHKHSNKVQYTCCQGKPGSPGCTDCKLHVWNGVEVGLNHHGEGFVRTHLPKKPAADGFCGVYALDCEMCYTVAGLEVTKVTVVGIDGKLVYDTLVQPANMIVDYNTRFSGITPRDLKMGPTKTLKQVQNDLRGFIKADTILIGHGLENDLRALKMVHMNVVDTSLSFPHHGGQHYKYSLKQLMATYLGREIQCGSNGHNSFEDAYACIELMVYRVRTENYGYLM